MRKKDILRLEDRVTSLENLINELFPNEEVLNALREYKKLIILEKEKKEEELAEKEQKEPVIEAIKLPYMDEAQLMSLDDKQLKERYNRVLFLADRIQKRLNNYYQSFAKYYYDENGNVCYCDLNFAASDEEIYEMEQIYVNLIDESRLIEKYYKGMDLRPIILLEDEIQLLDDEDIDYDEISYEQPISGRKL